MKEYKFKVGDQVEIITHESDQKFKVGETSTIESVYNDGVRKERGYNLKGDDWFWYSEDQLQLIENKQDCKFCIDNKIGFTHDSPNFREDFEYQGIGIYLLHFHNRVIIQATDYRSSQCFEVQRRFNFCPYCGKEL